MSNSLRALINLIERSDFKVRGTNLSGNRMNSQGISFEDYIEAIFCGRNSYEDTFAFKGDANHPPDFILKGGDAIEVKKHESGRTSTTKSDIALNSSHPRSYLYSDDEKITTKCKDCEKWDKKHMLYIIGSVDKTSDEIEYIWFVYGDCFAADREYYKGIENAIKEHLINIKYKNLEMELDGNELGKSKTIDPLEITDLRIRGMYQLTNPYKLFKDIIDDRDSNVIYDLEQQCQKKSQEIDSWTISYHKKKSLLQEELQELKTKLADLKKEEKKKIKIFFLVTKEKYDTFPSEDKDKMKELVSLNMNQLILNEISIKNPNDLSPLSAILIKYFLV